MKDERMDDLDRALRALAAETDEGAAPAVEERLRAAFAALPEPEPVPAERAPAPWLWFAALAAAAGAAWMVIARPAPPTAPLGTPPPAVARAQATPLPRIATPARVAPVVAAAPRPSRARTRGRQADPAPFEALYPGDPLADLEAVHVVRVSVPRSSLFALGLRQRPGSPDDAVEMDAMVGPDGVARAVRFVTTR